MARLSSFMGPFRIWRRHRNLCTVRTHLVTRYHIIQQVSTYKYYFFLNYLLFSRPLGLRPHLGIIRWCMPNIFPHSQFGFFLAGSRAKKILLKRIDKINKQQKIILANPIWSLFWTKYYKFYIYNINYMFIISALMEIT